MMQITPQMRILLCVRAVDLRKGIDGLAGICRAVREEEVDLIRRFIAEHPDDSRWMLSRKLCQAWGWVQANGALRDMVCRGLMLQLERCGEIELPPIRKRIVNPLVNRKKPTPVAIDRTPIGGKLGDLGPLQIHQVRRTEAEGRCNSLIQEHHYLGYCQPVGEQLKYLVDAQDRPIACLTWLSAPGHIGDRDRFIGWSKAIREKNLSRIACNTRFLILPWVRIPHLASQLLGKMVKVVKVVPEDRQRIYRHRRHYLETFVDRERFLGTCYRAANRLYIGRTTGRGKNDQTGKANRSLKDVLGYPLSKDFRDHLCKEQE